MTRGAGASAPPSPTGSPPANPMPTSPRTGSTCCEGAGGEAGERPDEQRQDRHPQDGGTVSRDVAVVAFASTSVTDADLTETQLLYPVITEAIEQSGIPRREIQFTCSGSCDYLAGAPFAF